MPVPSLSGVYEASAAGDIRRDGHILSKRINKKTGRYQVSMSVGNRKVTRHVHTLVCEAFNGPRPPGLEAAHKNGNRLDNRSSNLSWKTRIENEADKKAHGTVAAGLRNGKHTKPERTPRGEAAGKSSLTDAVVVAYREMMRRGEKSLGQAAREMGIAKSSAGAIKLGRTWTHV